MVDWDAGTVVDLGVTVDPLYKFIGQQIVDLADLDIFATVKESSPRPPTPPTSKAPAVTPASVKTPFPVKTLASDKGKVRTENPKEKGKGKTEKQKAPRPPAKIHAPAATEKPKAPPATTENPKTPPAKTDKPNALPKPTTPEKDKRIPDAFYLSQSTRNFVVCAL